jgi:hypothetical protein
MRSIDHESKHDCADESRQLSELINVDKKEIFRNCSHFSADKSEILPMPNISGFLIAYAELDSFCL